MKEVGRCKTCTGKTTSFITESCSHFAQNRLFVSYNNVHNKYRASMSGKKYILDLYVYTENGQTKNVVHSLALQ